MLTTSTFITKDTELRCRYGTLPIIVHFRVIAATVILVPLLATMAAAQCKLGVNSHGSQTLVLHASGLVTGFGYNNSGQVGDGTRENPQRPAKVLMGAYNGTYYLGDDPANPVIAVAALYRHSLALTADGSVFSWGANNTGELGNDTLGNQFTPIRPMRGMYLGTSYLGDNPTNPVTAISGGINYSMVIAKDGTLYGFGRNDYGQLGNNSTASTPSPMRVLKGAYPGGTFLGDDSANPVVAIAAGDYHFLALTKDGSLYAWGRNSNGQLGTGDTTGQLTPVRVRKGNYAGSTYLGDNAANGITAIRAGGNASIVILADGTVMSWGGNTHGKLGDNTTTDRWAPVSVLAGEYPGSNTFGGNPARQIRTISIGMTHVIALCEDGSVYGWGSNAFGNLGIGSGEYSATPVQVRRGEYPGTEFLGDNKLLRVMDVAAADEYSIAVIDTCDVYGWGKNQRMQLVEPSLQDHSTPIRIHGIDEELPGIANLAFFNAQLNHHLVELRWRTVTELRIDHFSIERRINSDEWTTIVSVDGQGNSTQPYDYSHDDDISELLTSKPTLTYRLKQIGADDVATAIDSVTLTLSSADVADNRDESLPLLYIAPSLAVASTTIEYQLLEQGNVRLELLDASGRIVRIITDDYLTAGTYRTAVDVESLASGLYLCRLSTDTQSFTQSLIVSK
jgi:alpha-tubulin suppressor-like RCC1 family protein